MFLVYEELSTPYFRPDWLLQSGDRLATRTVQAISGNGTIPVELAYERAGPIANSDFSDHFWAVAMSGADHAALALALTDAEPGTGLLSLADPVARADKYDLSDATLSFVSKPTATASVVARCQRSGLPHLYRHAAA